MKAPILTFFNNRAGVGKTWLIYHLAWMFAAMDKRIIVADFDPQANLTAAFLDEEEIEAILEDSNPGATVYRSLKSLTEDGEIAPPRVRKIATNIFLLPGDAALSRFEDVLAAEWCRSMAGGLDSSMRILTAFWRIMRTAEHEAGADMILVDSGSNFGAVNRSILPAADYIAFPLGNDIFSLEGLSSLGAVLKDWKDLWRKRLGEWRTGPEKSQYSDFPPPPGEMRPLGYLCRQYDLLLERPIKILDQWGRRIPHVYREAVLDESPVEDMTPENDPYRLATVKHYRTLIPMAREHRKPIFNLTPADGAVGSHAGAVRDAERDFRKLAGEIAARMGIQV